MLNFKTHDLIYSLPDPGDRVLPILEKRNLRSREEEVRSLRLTALESGRAAGRACGGAGPVVGRGLWYDDAAAVIAVSQLH